MAGEMVEEKNPQNPTTQRQVTCPPWAVLRGHVVVWVVFGGAGVRKYKSLRMNFVHR